MTPFDLHAPMDAPLRHRERMEQIASEKALKFMRSKKIAKMVRDALKRASVSAPALHISVPGAAGVPPQPKIEEL